MTTPQVSFNRRKVEPIGYLCHTPLNASGQSTKIKEMRNRIC